MKVFIVAGSVTLLILGAGYFALPSLVEKQSLAEVQKEKNPETESQASAKEPEPPKIIHLETPENVFAVYLTGWAAGTSSYRKMIDGIIDTTDINAVVIDIKDYSGRLSFIPNDKDLLATGSGEARIRDIDEYINYLHAKGVYVIGRLSAFQDPYMVKLHPEYAVKTKTGTVWKDRNGISWIYAGEKEFWNYLVKVANESYSRGFDEINFDYIRFPSDGDMKNISYPHDATITRRQIMSEFFTFLHDEFEDTDIVTSVDLFGLVTTAKDDLGIGQYLEDALPNFDYVAPMVYPSHFADKWNGYPKPAKEPYKVIYESMKKAVERTVALGLPETKLRPWIQDFDLGATYDAKMVRDQIEAAHMVGLDSFMVWDPAHKYQTAAFVPLPSETKVPEPEPAPIPETTNATPN